ncbi:hypothetical protein HN803_07570 [candidate division WWE3 bacterium]|jgi:antitoxin component of RelBE/YafQ-DinJ toxin-antitoxin module|nr:hypothetical protein [candidate division WWE3 bacterium]
MKVRLPIRIEQEVKDAYRDVCDREGIDMSKDLRRYIEARIEVNQETYDA